MKLKDINYEEFKKLAAYIGAICGYPVQSDDKLQIINTYISEVHGNIEVKQLQDAFIALAAGRLDEKLEGIKSFTGLSVSRVLQSYQRYNAGSTKQTESDRQYLNDENRTIIQNQFNRFVMFSDELTADEKDYLMGHWIEVNRQSYYEHKKRDRLTEEAYLYHERKGNIRVHNDNFQYFHNNQYLNICSCDDCERGGLVIKYNEDNAMAKAKQGFLDRFKTKNFGTLESAIRRYSLSLYYDKIK